MVFNDVLGPQRRSLCNALHRLARMSETIDGANLAAEPMRKAPEGNLKCDGNRPESPTVAVILS